MKRDRESKPRELSAFRLPVRLKRKLEAQARARDITLSELVVDHLTYMAEADRDVLKIDPEMVRASAATVTEDVRTILQDLLERKLRDRMIAVQATGFHAGIEAATKTAEKAV